MNTVEPIRDKKKIAAMKAVLKGQSLRNYLLIEQLQEIFNHPTPAVTRRYIGVTHKEISSIYRRINL